MAVVINTVDTNYFTLNGTTYAKIYQPLLGQVSTEVGLYNAFDTRLQLIASTPFAEFTVDSLTYASADLLLTALLPVVFKHVTAGGGIGSVDWADITGTISTNLALQAELDNKSDVGHLHTFASLTSKPTTLGGFGITNSYTNVEVDALVSGLAAGSHTHLVSEVTDFEPTDYLLLAGGTLTGALSIDTDSPTIYPFNLETTVNTNLNGIDFRSTLNLDQSIALRQEILDGNLQEAGYAIVIESSNAIPQGVANLEVEGSIWSKGDGFKTGDTVIDKQYPQVHLQDDGQIPYAQFGTGSGYTVLNAVSHVTNLFQFRNTGAAIWTLDLLGNATTTGKNVSTGGYTYAKRISGSGDTHIAGFGNSGTAGDYVFGGHSAGTLDAGLDAYIRINQTTCYYNNGTGQTEIWHAGNDGSGSGLDADTLRTFAPTTAATASTIVLRDSNAQILGASLRGNFVQFNTTSTGNSSNYDTEDFTLPANSIYTSSNTTGSLNYPTIFGQTLWVKGAGAERNFAFWRQKGALNTNSYLYAGTDNGAGVWNWGKIATENTPDLLVDAGSQNITWELRSEADCTLTLTADSDNITETHNPKLYLVQDGLTVNVDTAFGIEGDSGVEFTGSVGNYAYIRSSHGIQFSVGLKGVGEDDLTITTAEVTAANKLSANSIYTGYDSGVANSVSCSGWFRSSGSTGWFNATYGGGIYQTDSTYVRVYANKALQVDNSIYIAGANQGIIRGNSTARGYLIGSYNADGALTSSTGAIYVMGTSFKPTATDLANMYGVGYCYGSALSGVNGDMGTTPANQWGMYVAADGEARLWFNASAGISRQKGISYASNFTLNSDRRLKRKIKDYKAKDLGIRWRNFELKSEKGQYRVGVIAQELLETAPELVNQEDSSNYTVNNIDLLNAAMAQKDAEIASLKFRLEQVEAKMELIIKELL
jgi:hypothetical protein